MEPLWAVLGCLLVSLMPVHPAAVPTQETLVITRSETSTAALPELLEATLQPRAGPTTDEPTPPIKLTEMQVQSDVALRYAHTAVVTHVKNPAKKAQEATFRVLLPETAFISGFVMTLDGKSYKAYVKEKEEAKQIYNDAVSQGVGAAHIGAKARDSNHFTMSVNVEPGTVAIFNLTYEELLVRRNGVYNHAINLHPGTVVPKLTVTVNVKESEKITVLRVPEIRTGNEIDASIEDAQNPNAVIKRGHDDREATITFTPDVQEQKRLMEVYAAKTKQSQSSHYPQFYDDGENTKDDEIGVLGQFVVQYDVDRPKNGEVLLNDGYFVHFYAPTSLPPLNKHVVFVLDTSGSMMGRKIQQLQDAMKAILAELNKGDYFSIVEFSNGVLVHDLIEADKDVAGFGRESPAYSSESSQPNLVPPYQATDLNIAKAKIIIQRLDAIGGTNIDKALEVAVNLIQKGIGWTALNTNNTNVTKSEDKEVKTDDKKEETQNLEPIIIFLTDGDPTVGETNPTKIINRITEKNFGDKKASIFSLAFGEDADRKFLRKVSLRNEGFMRHIYEAADAALQLRHFYRQVASPLLADVKFTYPADQVKGDLVTKSKFRALYAGSETVVAGRVADLHDVATEFTPSVEGFCGVVDAPGRKKYGVKSKLTPVQKGDFLPLERLWAYLTIKQLLDKRDASDNPDDKDNEPRKKALDLALKYEFVTALTSLVVVKPNATKAVDAESVDDDSAPPPVYSANAFHMQAHHFPASSLSLLPGSAGFAGYPGPMPSASLFADPAAPQLDYEHSQVLLEEDDDIAVSQFADPAKPQMEYEHSHPLIDIASGLKYLKSQVPQQAFMSRVGTYGGGLFVNQRPHAATIIGAIPLRIDGLLSTTMSPLHRWHLEEFPWTKTLLDNANEAILVHTKNGTVSLRLSSESEVPKEAVAASCPRSPLGSAGVCVYLTRCDAAKQISPQTYSDIYCSIDGYAGVCCPPTEVENKTSR